MANFKLVYLIITFSISALAMDVAEFNDLKKTINNSYTILNKMTVYDESNGKIILNKELNKNYFTLENFYIWGRKYAQITKRDGKILRIVADEIIIKDDGDLYFVLISKNNNKIKKYLVDSFSGYWVHERFKGTNMTCPSCCNLF